MQLTHIDFEGSKQFFTSFRPIFVKVLDVVGESFSDKFSDEVRKGIFPQ